MEETFTGNLTTIDHSCLPANCTNGKLAELLEALSSLQDVYSFNDKHVVWKFSSSRIDSVFVIKLSCNCVQIRENNVVGERVMVVSLSSALLDLLGMLSDS